MKVMKTGHEISRSASGLRGLLGGIFMLLAALVLVGCPLAARADSLDTYIRAKMAVAKVPGIAACIVKDGQVVWSSGYGWANLETQTAVTPDTVFMIASISKVVTGTSLMQLFEQGVFTLDGPVTDHLPFSVSNPNYPDEPITFRQILSHASSIQDNPVLLSAFYSEGDSPIPLGLYLENYLSPGGVLYGPNRNFYDYAPGTAVNYSNIGFALCGYLVEAITGVSFADYCTQHLFVPLQMNETSWFLRDLDETQLAMPYQYDFKTRKYVAYGQYGYPDYPDGQLRTSARQLANFLIASINYGEFGSARILEQATAEEMRRVQYPELSSTTGLAWEYEEHNGETRLGHYGGDKGVTTAMWFRPSDGVGVIALANGDFSFPWQQKALLDILDRLFNEADQF